ncbi:glycosyl hydrolase family 18 protein [Gudongella sp. DL1XJH-153]|uniref:glycosyl hydrolase family 18 protein n=1 Tax=Gudongella sp. DL1XJH-153 TaxID=3409804 RepID=UPI003BB607D0
MNNKKNAALLFTLIFVFLNSSIVSASEETSFSDIPEDSQMLSIINEFSTKGILRGVSNDVLGYGNDITRAEFITFLVRVHGWDLIDTENSNFIDVQSEHWFHPYIETAALNDSFSHMDKGIDFRPNAPLTREQAALIIINSLGYEKLANFKNNDNIAFADVEGNTGYIELITNFGIMELLEGNKFAPEKTLKREEALSILHSLYNKLNNEIGDENVFYAVKSYSQKEMMSEFDRVSFGWASLEYNEVMDEVSLKLELPVGYEEPLMIAESNSSINYLNIYASNTSVSDQNNPGLLESLLSRDELYLDLIDQILVVLDSHKEFDGVVIDFEDMISEELKPMFSNFISELDKRLELKDKSIMVTVPPDLYYKAYDYRSLSDSADKLILMAHDYNAKLLTENEQEMGYTYTPLTPIEKVYDSLVAILDEKTGVEDRSKVSLQISFSTAQWGVDNQGKVVNKYPYTPTYEMLYNRIIQDGVDIFYDLDNQNPYIKYYNENDNMEYIIWYEDSRSIAAKIGLAKMFEIESLSFWRLGNFPDYSDKAGSEVYLNVLNSY